MVLSIGYYFGVVLGFNADVLQVYGKLRYLVLSSIGLTVVNLPLAFILTPRYGAVGAAVATSATMVGQNIVNQIVLNRITPATEHMAGFLYPYMVIGTVAAVLLVVELLVDPGIFVAVMAASVGFLVVLGLTRNSLRLAKTFPELGRVPLLRRFVR